MQAIYCRSSNSLLLRINSSFRIKFYVHAQNRHLKSFLNNSNFSTPPCPHCTSVINTWSCSKASSFPAPFVTASDSFKSNILNRNHLYMCATTKVPIHVPHRFQKTPFSNPHLQFSWLKFTAVLKGLRISRIWYVSSSYKLACVPTALLPHTSESDCFKRARREGVLQSLFSTYLIASFLRKTFSNSGMSISRSSTAYIVEQSE